MNYINMIIIFLYDAIKKKIYMKIFINFFNKKNRIYRLRKIFYNLK